MAYSTYTFKSTLLHAVTKSRPNVISYVPFWMKWSARRS